jgi:streptogrisin D
LRHSHTPLRRIAVAGAGIAAFVVSAVLLPSAHAATAAPAKASASTVASHLVTVLGDRSAGSYYDARTRRLVVDVTGPADASQVRAAGAVARTVPFSAAQLHSAMATLDQQARIPGTAWEIDPRSDTVVVTADPTVTGARAEQLGKAVTALGDKAQLRYTANKFTPFIAGGDAIWGPTVRCSLGFNVTVGGWPYFLTAGHCGNAADSWSSSQGGSEVAETWDSNFPGSDYALVRYDSSGSSHPSSVDLYNGTTQSITHAADAFVGESVERSGSTSGLHGGTVLGLDATVNYSEGTVFGLIDTDVCAEPGDSGGSLFDGTAAIGLTSGGSGDCSSGGETFFQPVTDALNAEGATIP